jgi:hypothetical protein
MITAPIPVSAQTTTGGLLQSIMEKEPGLFAPIINNLKENRVQIIYTQINRKKNGKISFTDHGWNLDGSLYFYPASTIKLPVAILALQKLNELKIAGLNKNTTMLTGEDGGGQTKVDTDTSATDGKPSIAHYIKKILLVSDNDASNRLYEFLGQEYINNTLHKMGYTSVQIIHRLDISLTEEQNRHTNPVRFVDNNGKIIYSKPAERSQLVYAQRDTKLGKGFYRSGALVNEPFDFSKRNRLPLADLHSIVRSIMFPESVPAKQRFNLTKDDYAFLQKYMSMLPGESNSPVYNKADYWPSYVKFLYYGSEKGPLENHIRIFNKVGDAYGFLIDAMYFADYKNNIEFMLSAVIHCNSDGIFNDDKYDYDTVGFPFMKNLGQTVYKYEQTIVRKRRVKIPVNNFNYSE